MPEVLLYLQDSKNTLPSSLSAHLVACLPPSVCLSLVLSGCLSLSSLLCLQYMLSVSVQSEAVSMVIWKGHLQGGLSERVQNTSRIIRLPVMTDNRSQLITGSETKKIWLIAFKGIICVWAKTQFPPKVSLRVYLLYVVGLCLWFTICIDHDKRTEYCRM